jgi:hypothetical protein
MPLAYTTKSRPMVPSGIYGQLVDVQMPKGYPPIRKVYTQGPLYLSKLKGWQITATANHPGFSNASPISGDVGGEFHMSLRSATFKGGKSKIYGEERYPGGDARTNNYVGTCLAIDPNSPLVQWPSFSPRNNSQVEALGTKAIAIVRPTNSPANLATALAELLREGLPKMAGATLWKNKHDAALHKGSSEYLNMEFGIKPLLNDLRDVYKTVIDADKLVEQYQRDAGGVVRRRFEFPSESWTETKVILESAVPYLPVSGSILMNRYPNATGRVIQTDRFYRKTWFSGAFTYYLPDDWYTAGRSKQMEKLLGLNVTPDVLWNATPWSWLADWFANTGDVISNMTSIAVDGLVMRYAYVMEHTRHVRTYSYSGGNPYNGEPPPGQIVLTQEVKTRRRASPYGFGLTFSGFSGRQLSILAALGITRSSKGK